MACDYTPKGSNKKLSEQEYKAYLLNGGLQSMVEAGAVSVPALASVLATEQEDAAPQATPQRKSVDTGVEFAQIDSRTDKAIKAAMNFQTPTITPMSLVELANANTSSQMDDVRRRQQNLLSRVEALDKIKNCIF